MYDCVINQRDDEYSVSPSDVIDRAVSIDPTFHGRDEKKLFYWVHRFIRRMNLSVRTRARVSQVLAADLHQGKTAFCRRIMTSFHNRVDNAHYFVNKDQTPVYMNCAPHRTVHRKGEKTVSIRVGGLNSQRFSLAVAVAMDGTKLPLFIVFKAMAGEVLRGACQELHLMDLYALCRIRDGWTLE